MKRLMKLLIIVLLALMIRNPASLCETSVLYLPDDLTRIEAEAFYGDTSITEAVLPDTIEYIGPLAFAGSGLHKINLPPSLREIDDTAFEGIVYLSAEVTPGTYAADWWDANKSRFLPTPITLQVGFENSLSEPIGRGLVKWQELLAKRNVGLNLELFPDSQLGYKYELIDQMLLGEPIMTTADGAFFADYGVKDMGIVFGPFLFDNWDQCWKLVESDWWTEQCGKLEALGIKIVAANWAYGARHTLTTKPVHTAADLKGLMIRVPTNAIQTKGFEVLGATPVGMSLGDVYIALEQGTIDGIENTLSSIYTRSHFRIAKYLILDGHVRVFTTWICSGAWFDKLTPEQQTALIETGIEAGVYNNHELASADAEYLALMKSAGVIVYEPTNADISTFRNLAEGFYAWSDIFGWSPDLYTTVKSAMGK